MSEVYNPESQDQERIEALEIDAVALAKKRDHARTPGEREIVERQLRETEDEIAALRHRLKARR